MAEAIKDSKSGKTLGIFVKDKDFPGAFMDNWRNTVVSKFATEDMSNPIAYIMATREDSELSVVKKACQATVDVFSKYLKEQVCCINSNASRALVQTNFKFKVSPNSLDGIIGF